MFCHDRQEVAPASSDLPDSDALFAVARLLSNREKAKRVS